MHLPRGGGSGGPRGRRRPAACARERAVAPRGNGVAMEAACGGAHGEEVAGGGQSGGNDFMMILG
uniref:Uncharacterized protein n=1 Tax=Oryza sativa subsp. japonica TaxID=39947 RepID=Q5Z736_ORYSJ|nr:hypothetical protein [Oryza sativa Japonica Group]